MTGVAQSGLRTSFRKARAAVLAATLPVLFSVGLGAAPARAAKIPAGMIPYDKPVYKNGRRVLYHGPSHGGGKASKASRAVSSKPDMKRAAAKAPASAAGLAPPAAVAAGTLGAVVPAPIFDAVAVPVRLTVAMDPRLGAELTQAMAARGVALTLAPDDRADLLVMSATPAPAAAPAQGLAAIARLYDCEAALVGPAGLATIADLAGKRVAAPPADSAAGRVARRLFAAAKIAATFVDAAPGEGGAAMSAGRADAYVVISPAPRIDDAPPGARLLAIPYVGALREEFLPAELAKAAFPALIDADSVDTVALPVMLAAVDPDRDPERRAALARFAEAFFSALGAGELPDAKWRDVNPAAKLPVKRWEGAQSAARRIGVEKVRAN